MTHALDPHRLRALAVAAHADPRSVRAVLRGHRLRGSVDTRVRAALEAQGIEAPVPIVARRDEAA